MVKKVPAQTLRLRPVGDPPEPGSRKFAYHASPSVVTCRFGQRVRPGVPQPLPPPLPWEKVVGAGP